MVHVSYTGKQRNALKTGIALQPRVIFTYINMDLQEIDGEYVQQVELNQNKAAWSLADFSSA